jgi:pimeloyl-ACP methyl ester carboxylesterase
MWKTTAAVGRCSCSMGGWILHILTQPDPIPCREWLPRNRTGPAWLRRSNRPVGVAAYSLQNAVDDLVGILDAFDIDAADIVGHDWGAAVAWLTATAHPNRVHKLVVLVLGLALAPRPKATLAQSRYEALANALFNWGGLSKDDTTHCATNSRELSPRDSCRLTPNCPCLCCPRT